MKIYNVGNRVVNTYVYRAQAGYVMVDTGYEHSFTAVVRGLKKRDISLRDIKYVFLTHAHDDHAGFLNELLEKCPQIKVIASGRAIPTLLRGQNSFAGGCSGIGAFAFCKFMGLLGKGRHLFPPVERRYLDRFIEVSPQTAKDTEALLEGKILFTPGHTADSISLKIDDIIFLRGRRHERHTKLPPDHNMGRGQSAVSKLVGYSDRGTRKVDLSRPWKPV